MRWQMEGELGEARHLDYCFCYAARRALRARALGLELAANPCRYVATYCLWVFIYV